MSVINQSDNSRKRKTVTLIMKGGGVKGLAYVSAIRELESEYEFDRFVGTSAGAIAAILLAAGYSVAELETILVEKNFSDFLDAKSIWQKGWNLVSKQGLHEAHAFTDWLDDLLAKKLDSPTRVKLKQLKHRVTVYASRRNKSVLTFDSHDPESADRYAAFAARCSMSIPYLFTPQKHDGYRVYDGGIQNNYPVKQVLIEDPDTNFLSLFLGPETYRPVRETFVFLDLVSITLEGSDEEVLEEFRESTIVIDPAPVGMVDFDLTSDEKQFLSSAGKHGARKHLSPTDPITVETRALRDQLREKANEVRKPRLAKKKLKQRGNIAILVLILFACVAAIWNYLWDLFFLRGIFGYSLLASVAGVFFAINVWKKNDEPAGATIKKFKYSLGMRLLPIGLLLGMLFTNFWTWNNSKSRIYEAEVIFEGEKVRQGEVTLVTGDTNKTTNISDEEVGHFRFINVSKSQLENGKLEFKIIPPGGTTPVTISQTEFDYRQNLFVLTKPRKSPAPRPLQDLLQQIVDDLADDGSLEESLEIIDHLNPVSFFLTLNKDCLDGTHGQEVPIVVDEVKFRVLVQLSGNFTGKKDESIILSGFITELHSEDTPTFARLSIERCWPIEK